MKTRLTLLVVVLLFVVAVPAFADAGAAPHVQGSGAGTVLTGYQLSDAHLLAHGTTVSPSVCLYFFNDSGAESYIDIAASGGSWLYDGSAPTQVGYFEFDVWGVNTDCNGAPVGSWFWLDNTFVSGHVYTWGTLLATSTPAPSATSSGGGSPTSTPVFTPTPEIADAAALIASTSGVFVTYPFLIFFVIALAVVGVSVWLVKSGKVVGR